MVRKKEIMENEMMISVWCYTYNHERYISDAIEGFLMQKTVYPFEVIIYDDASTDSTIEIIKKYQQKYGNKIKLLHEKENIYSKEKNFKTIDKKILKATKGKYIALCEGDDYWIDEYKLEKQVNYMEEHPDCTLCFHNSLMIKENGKIESYVFPQYTDYWQYKYYKGYGEYRASDMLRWDCVATASMLYRKEDFLKIPEFMYDYTFADMVLRQSLTYQGYAYFMPDTMSVYRTAHKDFIEAETRSTIENRNKGKLEYIEIYEQLNHYMNYEYDKEIKTAISHLKKEIVLSYDFEGWVWWTKFDEIMEYSKSHEKIFLFGAGLFGRFCETQLALAGISIDGYLVSEGQVREKECNGHKVYYPHEIGEELKNSGIIVCAENSAPICQLLDRRKYSHYIVMNVELKERPVTKEDKGIYQGGLLRLRITNRCPAKCRYCGVKKWPLEEQLQEMDPKWYYEYLKPMYPRFKTVLLSGGDCFVAKEAYNYMKFLSEQYPHITIWTESNGVLFVRKFQEIACDNLSKTHFSVNASNPETFVRGCWSGDNGQKIYETIMTNIRAYIQLLKENGKECFAPSMSMVINKDTYDDVVNFVKLALELGASFVIFYFDYSENDLNSDYFSGDEGRTALRNIMEMERVLKGHFFIDYKFRTPMKEVETMRPITDALSLEGLREKYSEIVKLAEKRFIIKEFEQRNEFRKQLGKLPYSLEEDYDPTMQSIQFGKKIVCQAPWSGMDLYPNGRLDCCGWHSPMLNLYDFIKDDAVDWEKIIDSEEYQLCRNNMLNGCYGGCMKYCPYNGEYHEIKSILE